MRKKIYYLKNKKLDIIILGVILAIISICFALYMYTTNSIVDSEKIICTKYSDAILSDDLFEQEVNCEKDTLESISLQFGTYARVNNSHLKVSLLDKNKNNIYEWNISSSSLLDNQYYEFKIDKPLTGMKNQLLYIRVTSDSENESDAVAIGLNDQINKTEKLTNKNKEIDNTTLGYILIYKNYNDLLLNISICTLLLISLITCFIVVRKKDLHNIYAFIFPILAIMYLITLPMFRVPDETNHFLRTYEIANGSIISDQDDNGNGGNELPKNIILPSMPISQIPNYRNETLENNKVFYSFSNTSLYSPICYLPQVVGVKVASIFTDKVIKIFYLSRIFNLITIYLITYFSIKYIPFGKALIILISLIPINMQENISVAPDGMLTAIIFALVSFTLYMRYSYRDIMKTKHYIIMYILAILISMYKIVYIPLCLLLFLIPECRFKSKKSYQFNVIILGSIIVVLSAIWLKIASRYLVEFNPNVDSFEQVRFILLHPLKYLMAVINTLFTHGDFYILSMIGSSLGLLNININLIIIYAYIGIFISLFIRKYETIERKDNTLTIITLSSVLCVIILIFTSLYVQWTPVGKNVIDGIQGRYFIPLMLPVLIGLVKEKQSENEIEKQKKRILFAIFMNLCVIITLLYVCYI